MNIVKRAIGRLDRYQRSHTWAGFPMAVVKKFGEDKAGQLAALVAYYGFFSLFPLLLTLVTVLAYVLGEDPELQGRILNTALAQFPVVGEEIKRNIDAIGGSGLALAVGIVGALWAGLGGIKAAQNAMDQVWDVPFKRQPNFVKAILRALVMLATIGVFLLFASFLGGVAAGTNSDSLLVKVGGIAGSAVLNFLLFWVAFKVMTVADVSWRDVLPGALLSSVLWTALQALGGYIIGHRLDSTGEVYGFFALVIALLSWIYLGAQITLVAAEMNVVRVRRLWPRALDPEHMTEADERALRELAKVEERREDQRVDVRFERGRGDVDEKGVKPSPPPTAPRAAVRYDPTSSGRSPLSRMPGAISRSFRRIGGGLRSRHRP